MNIPRLEGSDISRKRVLVRVDFDVPLNADRSIADDTRIRINLETLNYLLKKNNRLILIAKLGRPEGHDKKFSLKPVVERLPTYMPGYTFELVEDFTTNAAAFDSQEPRNVLVLENIRFYPEETTCDSMFIEKLAALGDIYVNDAFAMSHRREASVVGFPTKLPSYAGFSLIKEVEMISKAINNPQRPFVTIMGGAKISSKINLIEKFIDISDRILIGGGLANTFLAAQGIGVGKSLCEHDQLETARTMLALSKEKRVPLELPIDARVGDTQADTPTQTVDISNIPEGLAMLDIGPKTEKIFCRYVNEAQTILWNGPMGYFEKEAYRQGSMALLKAITNNTKATSVVGGGDTLAAIGHGANLDKITHISTAGGAMLEFIEKGTLPGLEALMHSPLENSPHHGV